MLRVAILGASGFIGSRLVERLHLENKALVRPIVRSHSSAACLARFDLDIRIADALDTNALRQAFADCDAVIHTAGGEATLICGSMEPVYQAAQSCGVKRLVYLSTASVHGQAPAAGTNENSPLKLGHPIDYNNQKIIAERKILSLRSRGSVETVVLRPSIVFGPRCLLWIASAAEALLSGKAYLINDGLGVCNTIYVDNLIDAIDLSLVAASRDADGQVFLVGDQERVTWFDVYSSLAAAFGIDPATIARVPCPVFKANWKDMAIIRWHATANAILSPMPTRLRLAGRAFLSALAQAEPCSPSSTEMEISVSQDMALLQSCQYKLPHDKATAQIGYQPKISFPEGMRRTIDWLEFAGYPVLQRSQVEAGLSTPANLAGNPAGSQRTSG